MVLGLGQITWCIEKLSGNESTGTRPDYLVNRDDKKLSGHTGKKIAWKSRNSCRVNGRSCGCIGTDDSWPKCAQSWNQIKTLKDCLWTILARNVNDLPNTTPMGGGVSTPPPFFGRKCGHKQRMCSGCGGRSLFFHSWKEFGNVLCTFLIIGWEWMLEKMVAWGKPNAVPVKGVEFSRFFHLNSCVWKCIRTCLLG